MNIYKSRFVQVVLVALYTALWFGLLAGHNVLSPWVLIVAPLVFCALWSNVWNVFTSTLIMMVIDVPIWWFAIAPHQVGYTDIFGWYPLIMIEFVIFILLPEILLVWMRNFFVGKLVR